MAKELETIVIGDCLEGQYPRHNLMGFRTGKYVKRTFIVRQIRNLNIAPLSKQTLKQTPAICRGDILLTGLDLDSGEERSFYVASFKSLRKVEPRMEEKPLRVLILDDAHQVIGSREFSDDKRKVYCEFFNANADDSKAVAIG